MFPDLIDFTGAYSVLSDYFPQTRSIARRPPEHRSSKPWWGHHQRRRGMGMLFAGIRGWGGRQRARGVFLAKKNNVPSPSFF